MALSRSKIVNSLKLGFKEKWLFQQKSNVELTQKSQFIAEIGCSNVVQKKKESMILAKPTIGHVRTNHYLKKFNIKNSKFCEVFGFKEVIKYILSTWTKE